MARASSNIILISTSEDTKSFFSFLFRQHFKKHNLIIVSSHRDIVTEKEKLQLDAIIIDEPASELETTAKELSDMFSNLSLSCKVPLMALIESDEVLNKADRLQSFGIDDVVFRPIDDRELLVRIRMMLRIKAAEEENRIARLRILEMESAHQSELVAKEKRYQRLVEISPDAILICNEGKITFINNSGKMLLRLSNPETLIGRPLIDIIHPESIFAIRRILQDSESAKTQTPFSLIKLRAENGSVANAEAVAVPFDDNDNKSVMLVFRDIAGRPAMTERFQQSQRMEAVGQLAGGVAHDFNNILTTIRGYSDLLLDTLKKEDPLVEDVKEIKNATERAASLTRQLLAFSRRQQMAPAPLDINRVVSDIQRMLKRMIGDHIELITDLEPDLGIVKADRSQIEQVIMNLCVNARDAMLNGGTITIRTSNIEIKNERPESAPDISPGTYALLEVKDTGVGISQDIIFHIFEPFFTTKPKDMGTGLGLSTVYGIVKQSGGDISVQSTPNKGTVFRIYLPIVSDYASENFIKFDRGPAGGSETILLVEDDKTVRYLAKRLLERAGYKVIPTANGAEALFLAEQHKGDIHLILTDVVMPEMGGTALVEKLAKKHRNLKAILMSGYSDKDVIKFAERHSGVVFLPKPFSYEELTQKVRSVLDCEDNT